MALPSPKFSIGMIVWIDIPGIFIGHGRIIVATPARPTPDTFTYEYHFADLFGIIQSGFGDTISAFESELQLKTIRA